MRVFVGWSNHNHRLHEEIKCYRAREVICATDEDGLDVARHVETVMSRAHIFIARSSTAR